MLENLKRRIKKIESLSKDYEGASKSINTPEGLEKCAELSLDIFREIASFAELPLNTVCLELERAFESKEVTALEFILEESSPSPRIPEFGNFKASRAKGTVIFVDITGSTKYFQKEDSICYIDNYTGFVIFNSYILLGEIWR